MRRYVDDIGSGVSDAGITTNSSVVLSGTSPDHALGDLAPPVASRRAYGSLARVPGDASSRPAPRGRGDRSRAVVKGE